LYGIGLSHRKNQLGFLIDFFFICPIPNPINMIPNRERLKIEVAIRPHIQAVEVINLELQKVNGSIERKWRQLDDFSASWSYTMWQNWKDAMQGEISYREYLLIILEAYKK
jgi:hypothetical protein